MDDTEFDTALVTAAFNQAGLTGWRSLSIVEAAQSAGLPLDRARARFPGPAAVLMRFGVMADQAALTETTTEPRARDRLFDLLMRRFDVLQAHRQGVTSLLEALPTDPLLSLALTAATARSMGWMLEAAGISATGFRGQMRAQGLVGVWLYTLRAWKDDASPDLAGTMAALDKALDQAARFSSMLGLDSGSPVESTSPDLAPDPVEQDRAEQDMEQDMAAEEGVVDVAATPILPPSLPPPPPPMEPPSSPPI